MPRAGVSCEDSPRKNFMSTQAISVSPKHSLHLPFERPRWLNGQSIAVALLALLLIWLIRRRHDA